MKQLLKAWKDYKGSFKGRAPYWEDGDGNIWTSTESYLRPSFEGFMDYLVNKETKKKHGK